MLKFPILGSFRCLSTRRGFTSAFLDNAETLWEKYGDHNGLLSRIFQHKHPLRTTLLDQHPHPGSLIKFKGQYGIVLGELQYMLSNRAEIPVVLPNSTLIDIPFSQIDLSIPDFINGKVMEQLFEEPSDVSPDKLALLVYTLNVTIHESLKLRDFIQQRNSLSSSYLSMADISNQRAFHITDIVHWHLENDLKLKRMLETSPMLINSLILSIHEEITEDPVMFRISPPVQSIYTPLHPMENITTKFFFNPINLMTKLNSIIGDDDLEFKYKHILLNSNNFQLAKQYGIDQGFNNLVQLMKYTVLNPHEKLLLKIKPLFDLPSHEPFDQHWLYNFLKEKNLYDDGNDTLDFINESGVFNLKSFDERDLPVNLSNLSRPDIIKNLQGLDRIVESFNEENEKVEKVRQSYKLTNDLVFSIEKISITSNKINLLIPIPKYLPQRGAKLSKAIGNVREMNYFIKLSFVHNLLNSNSIQTPQISIDCMKNFPKVDENWFEHRNNPEFTNYDERKLKCWTSLNKLYNFLIEWEKGRLLRGYLKINHDLIRDKQWMVYNLKLVIDEQLSSYCAREGVSINFKENVKLNSSSVDKRIFQKFKLFKWIGNSYDTFNFQLTSNPNDFTAFVSCLKYLKPVINRFGKSTSGGTVGGYDSLGLKSFGCFAGANDHLEGYMNVCNLFRHLITTRNTEMLKPLRVYSDVCEYHFKLMASRSIFNWRRVLIETLRVLNTKLVKREITVEEGLISAVKAELKDEPTTAKADLKAGVLRLNGQVRELCNALTKYTDSASVIGRRGFQKCIGDEEGVMDIKMRHKRSREIEGLQRGETLGRCIVIDAVPTTEKTFKCFCFDLDLIVDVKVSNAQSEVKVGDRLICTRVLECDKLTGSIVLE